MTSAADTTREPLKKKPSVVKVALDVLKKRIKTWWHFNWEFCVGVFAGATWVSISLFNTLSQETTRVTLEYFLGMLIMLPLGLGVSVFGIVLIVKIICRFSYYLNEWIKDFKSEVNQKLKEEE